VELQGRAKPIPKLQARQLRNLTIAAAAKTIPGRDSRLSHTHIHIHTQLYAVSATNTLDFTGSLTHTMGGFDFSNHNRNAALHAQGIPLPKATSTGTTIVGCLFNGGVVIAADTRATSGPIVADKVGLSPSWTQQSPCILV
jgi:hypothetical protein